MRAALAARLAATLAAATFAAAAAPVQAQQHQHHGGVTPPTPPSPPSAPATFVASTARPFAALMDDAMAVMDAGMRQAPMNGLAEHDFITMMIPHHQGAVDMAKAVLLSTQDPEIRNLALGIIAEQQVEIDIMKAWLQHHTSKESSQ